MDSEVPEVPAAGLTKEQKTSFFLLLIFAILSIGLGLMKIRNTLYGPFALNSKVPSGLKEQLNTTESLRYRDTDNDGLTDFDEQFIYNTSVYLADTDSDGQTDRQEVERGANPLCAEGRDCDREVTAETASAIGSSSSIYLDANSLGKAPPDLKEIISNPVKIRQLLLDAGVAADVLKKISDSELMSLVGQMLSATGTLNGIQSLNKLAVPASSRP